MTRDAFERISGDAPRGPACRGARWTPCTWTCTGPWWPSTSTTPTAKSSRRVRNEVGPAVPVVASLDFHANVLAADGACRPRHSCPTARTRTWTWPRLRRPGRPRCCTTCSVAPRCSRVAWSKMDFLIPPHFAVHARRAAAIADVASRDGPNVRRSCPCASRRASRRPTWRTAGHPAVRVRHRSSPPSESVVTPRARRTGPTRRVNSRSSSSRPSSRRSPSVRRGSTAPRGRPLILADTQDNPGAGGNADTIEPDQGPRRERHAARAPPA